MSNLVVGVGLIADTVMTAAKAGVGAWSGSPALLSDAVHGLADMLVSVAVIVTRCAEASATLCATLLTPHTQDLDPPT